LLCLSIYFCLVIIHFYFSFSHLVIFFNYSFTVCYCAQFTLLFYWIFYWMHMCVFFGITANVLLKFYAVGLSRAVMRSENPDCTVCVFFLPFTVECIVSLLVLCQSLPHVALMLNISINLIPVWTLLPLSLHLRLNLASTSPSLQMGPVWVSHSLLMGINKLQKIAIQLPHVGHLCKKHLMLLTETLVQ